MKKKKARKPTAVQRQLAADWDALVKKHAPKKLLKPIVNKPLSTLDTPPRGDSIKINSLNEWVTGIISSKPRQYYTGTKMLGISIVHKSCLQPVFSEDEAKDLASMRR